MTTKKFEVKDSGNRQEFTTGSRRDTADDKPDYTLESRHAKKRLAYHLGKGAKKYGRRNWELGQPVSRFLESLYRHVEQYAAGDQDEDHLAAILFNAGGIIHMEEEVELGNLPTELLDLPFYKKEPLPIIRTDGLTDQSLKDQLYEMIAKRAKEVGIGHSIGLLFRDVLLEVKVPFKDLFPPLNDLLAEGKLVLAHTKPSNGTDVYVYFPSYYTHDEIKARLTTALGECKCVLFYDNYDPFWEEQRKAGGDDDFEFDDCEYD